MQCMYSAVSRAYPLSAAFPTGILSSSLDPNGMPRPPCSPGGRLHVCCLWPMRCSGRSDGPLRGMWTSHVMAQGAGTPPQSHTHTHTHTQTDIRQDCGRKRCISVLASTVSGALGHKNWERMVQLICRTCRLWNLAV
jgi:hypothetical protein